VTEGLTNVSFRKWRRETKHREKKGGKLQKQLRRTKGCCIAAAAGDDDD
jgi:hypothetical protein